MDLQISDWANIAEIVGALAVTISLVFVGLQVRANTVATQSATYQDAVGHEISILLAISATPETAVKQNIYLNDPGALDKRDFEQVRGPRANRS
jgi:hypothetical protein